MPHPISPRAGRAFLAVMSLAAWAPLMLAWAA